MDELSFRLILGVLVRAALMALAGIFVAHGWMQQGDVTDWVGATLAIVLSIAWSLYQKYVQKKLLVTAATMPAASLTEVRARATSGAGPTVSEVLKSTIVK